LTLSVEYRWPNAAQLIDVSRFAAIYLYMYSCLIHHMQGFMMFAVRCSLNLLISALY